MALEKTWRWFGQKDSISLADLKQMGVEGVVTALHHIPNGKVWPVEEIISVKQQIEKHGMRWSVVESLPVSEGIKTRSADAPWLIENYKQSLRNLGACGIDTVCYNFMPVLDWARTNLHYSTPYGESMYFDYNVFAAFDIHILQRPGAEGDYSPDVAAAAKTIAEGLTDAQKDELAHNIIVVTQGFIDGVIKDGERDYKKLFLSFIDTYKEIDADGLRQNLSHFLKEVVPVAEASGVRMCIHPDDPPFPVLGLPRIAGTLADFKWICEQVDSISNGVSFCTGSLSAREDNDLPAMARELAPRIHFAHLRNNMFTGNRSFYESGHLTGRIDMYAVVKALLQEQMRRKDEGREDTRMPFRPDHGLKILDDFSRTANPGYPLIGRLKGLSEIAGLMEGIERGLLEEKEKKR